MATQDPSVEQSESIIDAVQALSSGDSLERFLNNSCKRTMLELDDWIEPLKESSGKLAIRFSSAEGAHYISYIEPRGFVAVYAGPAGPENRPAEISRSAIAQLLQHADDVSIEKVRKTPLANPIIADLLKKE